MSKAPESEMKEEMTDEALKVLTTTLYKKQNRDYLDHLYQGGLVESMINIRYNTETQEIETEVVNVRK